MAVLTQPLQGSGCISETCRFWGRKPQAEVTLPIQGRMAMKRLVPIARRACVTVARGFLPRVAGSEVRSVRGLKGFRQVRAEVLDNAFLSISAVVARRAAGRNASLFLLFLEIP